MGDNELNQLADQLLDGASPRIRRDAAEKLGQRRDPMAIAFLVQSHNQEQDKSVRKAVREALLVYRQMERDAGGGPATAASAGGGIPAGLLGTVRRLLTILLVVLIVGNVVVLGMRAVSTAMNQPTPTPVQTAPDPRDTLVAQLQARANAIDTEARTLRPLFTTFQVEIEALGEKPRCSALGASDMAITGMADVNRVTYPDLGPVSDQLDAAAQKLLDLRARYQELCALPDFDAVSRRAQELGGPAALVQALDAALSGEFGAGRNLLVQAIEQPAATVGPTFTASPPPTVEGAQTAIAQATIAATAAGPTAEAGTPQPTPSPEPSATPSPTVTPSPTPTPRPFAFAGLKLADLSRFRARFDMRYSGLTAAKDEFRGSAQVILTFQQNPPLGQLDLSVREAEPSIIEQEGVLPANLYAPGNTTISLIDGVYYVEGNLLSPGVACRATRAPADAAALFQSPAFEAHLVPAAAGLGITDLNQAGLSFVSSSGNQDTYRAENESATEDNVVTRTTLEAVIDTTTGRLVRYLFTLERDVPSIVVRQEITSLSVEYQLQQVDQAVDVNGIRVSMACRGAPVQ
ncbi:MAG: HEAT repeat domain-containing protein [Anaerolineae bacterium]|nr:HEAT repeat domain-containing protein [Anaerolineae bacterium]